MDLSDEASLLSGSILGDDSGSLSLHPSNQNENDLSDAEEFPSYISYLLDDQDDIATTNSKFSHLSSIDGSIHISGNSAKLSNYHPNHHAKAPKTPMDDDLFSDDEGFDGKKSKNGRNADANNQIDDQPSLTLDDLTSAQSESLTLEDLMRPPQPPTMPVIKSPTSTTQPNQPPPPQSSLPSTTKTIRFAVQLVREKEFIPDDPAAKCSAYAGPPGNDPPSTYVGVPMEFPHRHFEPVHVVNIFRTSTSSSQLAIDKRMITSCIQQTGYVSQYDQQKGFDLSCQMGFYDLTELSNMRRSKLQRWDRYMDRIWAKNSEIYDHVQNPTQSTSHPSVPSKSDEKSPNPDSNGKNEIKREYQPELYPILVQERQQNVFVGGGPLLSGIGIGYYRLLETIKGVEPIPGVDNSVFNPIYLLTNLHRVPNTFPFAPIKPTHDAMTLFTSYFPSIPFRSNYQLITSSPPSGQTSSSSNPYKSVLSTYFEQVLLSKTPRGHCETVCSLIEQKRLGLAKMSTQFTQTQYNLIVKSPQHPTHPTTATNQQNNVYLTFLFPNFGNPQTPSSIDADTTMDNDDLPASNYTYDLKDFSIPVELHNILSHYSTIFPQYSTFYHKFNGLDLQSATITPDAQTTIQSITSPTANQQKIKALIDSNAIVNDLRALFLLDRLSFHSLEDKVLQTKSATSMNPQNINAAASNLQNPSTPTPTPTPTPNQHVLFKKYNPIQHLPPSTPTNNTTQSTNEETLFTKSGPTIQPINISYRLDNNIITSLTSHQQTLKYGESTATATSNWPRHNLSHTTPAATTTFGSGFMSDISMLSQDDVLYHNSHLESGESSTLLDMSLFSALDDDDFDFDLLSQTPLITPSTTPLSTPKLQPALSSTQLPSTPRVVKPSLTNFSLFDTSTSSGSSTPASTPGGLIRLASLSSSRPTTPSLSAFTPRFLANPTLTPLMSTFSLNSSNTSQTQSTPRLDADGNNSNTPNLSNMQFNHNSNMNQQQNQQQQQQQQNPNPVTPKRPLGPDPYQTDQSMQRGPNKHPYQQPQNFPPPPPSFH